MPKLLSLFSCWLLLSGSISQAPPADFPDVPVITANSVGKARIGMKQVLIDSLYAGCEFEPAFSGEYGPGRIITMSGKPDAVVVSKSSQVLFTYFLDWQTKTKIAGLVALHPAYKTVEGIHVGNTWQQLKIMLPEARAAADSKEVRRQAQLVVNAKSSNNQFMYMFFRGRRHPIRDSSILSQIAVIDAKTTWINGE